MLKRIWASTPWVKAQERRRLAIEAQNKRFERAFMDVFCPNYEQEFRRQYCGSLLYFHVGGQVFQAAWYLTFSEAVRTAKRFSADGRYTTELEDIVRGKACEVAALLSTIIMLEVAINTLKTKEVSAS